MIPVFSEEEKQVLEKLLGKMLLPCGKSLKDELIEIIGFRLMGTVLGNGNTFAEEIHYVYESDYVKDFRTDDGQIKLYQTKFDDLIEKLQQIFPLPEISE